MGKLSRKYFPFVIGIVVILLSGWRADAQECPVRVSLLTISPGDELYSTFGHSALRVFDSTSGRDMIFNYGTFDFEEPGFYLKFIQGKLRYFVSVEEYADFEQGMMMENRSITEQILQLTCDEKQNVRQFLQQNLLPQNRYYKYDFTFDNCTTRLGELVEAVSEDSVDFSQIDPDATFRNAIHEYLERNGKSWSKLGIDILLGSRLDRKMTPVEAMFLPDNLMHAFDSATINGRPLVLEKEVILRNRYQPHSRNNITSPLFLFSCLFVIVAFLSFSTNRRIQRILASFDGVLFFLNGMTGLLLIFMWFFTDHYMTADNYNLLWAWPTNLVAAFYVHSKMRWPKIYFWVFGLSQILLLSFWFFLPQEMNIALIPLNGILIFRCFLYNPLNKRIHG